MIQNVKQLNDYLLTSILILGRDKKYRVRNALNAHKLMVGPAYFMMLYWKDQTFFTISSNLRLLVVFHVIYGMLWVVKDLSLIEPVMEESRHAGVGFEYVFYTVVSVLFTLVLPCTVPTTFARWETCIPNTETMET